MDYSLIEYHLTEASRNGDLAGADTDMQRREWYRAEQIAHLQAAIGVMLQKMKEIKPESI